jgi:hypothetical protein
MKNMNKNKGIGWDLIHPQYIKTNHDNLQLQNDIKQIINLQLN